MKKNENPINYQYARGNVAKIESLNNALKITVGVNTVDKKGEKHATFIDVLASGKKQETVTALNIEKGDFIEIDGKFDFQSSKDKNDTYHMNNTMYLNTIKKHSLEEGKAADFSQKHSNVMKLKGNLVDEPKIVQLANGDDLAVMKVAVNENYTKKGETEVTEKVTFVEIAYFKDQAKNVKEAKLKKGDPMIIGGSLYKTALENKTGNKEYKASITGYKFEKNIDLANIRETAKAEKKNDNTKDKKQGVKM
jgi:single stranded DNA-binding protein